MPEVKRVIVEEGQELPVHQSSILEVNAIRPNKNLESTDSSEQYAYSFVSALDPTSEDQDDRRESTPESMLEIWYIEKESSKL